MKVLLTEEEMPREYYNILPDLPRPLDPPLHPGTRKPASASDFKAIFCDEIVRQEMLDAPTLRIPDEVRTALFRMGRPTPLVRARRLETALNTPARIFFKNESLNPCGSHKPNTAIAQAYYNARAGVEELVTETGAGQWGTALAYACMLFGLKCRVFMVRVSFKQKPYRRIVMNAYGASVSASPSRETKFGRSVLQQNPAHPGSLGVAISEAIETVVARGDGKAKYALGSVLNHVMLHQTVIGLEAKAQLAKIDAQPDALIACVGGGSNFGGFVFPFVRDKLRGKLDAELVAVEPKSCPSTTEGRFEYDFGDTAGMTPLLKMYTLGHDFVPSPIHAGGLRYHGMAPTVSLLVKERVVRPRAYAQDETFEAGALFARTEGIIPAPESSHAIKAAIDLARECKKTNEAKTIVFNLSGHGLLDLAGYQDFFEGKLGGANASSAGASSASASASGKAVGTTGGDGIK
ncbi:MAG: TrpB-like pyridoxal phosphate-dependent enzyme [Candidatus Micrarchaeota archaeon]